jgi:16S rRNA (uracil1498-N3)-methyltransferase
MHIFYCKDLDEKGGLLGKEESHHAFRVLRLTVGQTIGTTLGKGIIYESRITHIDKQRLEFENLRVLKEEKRSTYLHIAIAPTKSLDRFETFLEKATELGIDEITPIFSHHSERKTYKTERGRKVILAAAKQSQSAWLPVLNEPQSFKAFLEVSDQKNRFIAHCEEGQTKRNILKELHQLEDSNILIGPEGDFSTDEIYMALAQNIQAVSLGSKRLRTETAGIVVTLAAKAFD